ncbi:MAG: alpha/beta fold hydrolase [Bacteroidota bacterium]
MPLINSSYHPPVLFRNGHFATIYASAFRKIHGLEQQRERIELMDGDFLDLDWSRGPQPTKKLVILLHGLEGDANRHYIRGSALGLLHAGYDICALNFRGCSGTPNRLYRSYHSGNTSDLAITIAHCQQLHSYKHIFLMGFSLGGNVALKYVGEQTALLQEIKAVVGISVPCSLKDVCDQLQHAKNRLYAARFKKKLLAKLRVKQEQFPDQISEQTISRIRTLKDFDDAYTAPAHGFKDALDYYEQCSCDQFLPHITIPALIINAKNDSFLGPDSYPLKKAAKNPMVFLEIPSYGGHVGFWGAKNKSYAEQRAVDFFNNVHL